MPSIVGRPRPTSSSSASAASCRAAMSASPRRRGRPVMILLAEIRRRSLISDFSYESVSYERPAVSSTRYEPPVAPRVRALAPDLARGTMLAVIALAHSQVLAQPFLGPVPAPGPAVDTAVQALLTLFVDSRGYPMFAALFGYGMVQILRSREPALGWEGARRLLRRRGTWLVVFGFVHVLLLFPGDILASYGVLALLFVGALRWPAARLFAVAGTLAVLGALAYGSVLALPSPGAPAEEVDPLTSAAFRVATFPLAMPMNAVMAAAPLLVG